MSSNREFKPYDQKGDTVVMSSLPEKPPPKYEEKKLKYPKSVFFIIGNEFCERFSYYGMRTILSLYLSQALRYSETTSTVIYHTFVMLCYFTPVLGGIMADSWLGKYKTILYVSIFYALGNIVLSVSSISILNIPHATLSLVGLFLIASGTGGIKPCVSSFGGDQFVLPQQESQLQRFFSVFYFSINAGSVLSCFLTPLLREEVKCFGQENCYPLAFGIPAALMCLSLVIFICGKPLYKIRKPNGNIAMDVAKCVSHALVRKVQTQKMEKKNHWLDYAAPKCSLKLIEDTKILMRIIFLFTPTIIFWALYDQQGSKWTFQANNMDGSINGWFTVQPDQMQTINPVLCLIFIPIFESAIYPFFHKIRLIRTPLQKLSWGGILAAVAFLISGFLELQIEKDKAIVPNVGEAQLRFYNTFNCPIHIELPDVHVNHTLAALDTTEFLHLTVSDKKILSIEAYIDKSCDNNSSSLYSGKVELRSKEISSYIFTSPLSLQILNITGSGEVQKSNQGFPKLKILYSQKESLEVQLKGPTNPTIHVNNYQSLVTEIKERGKYYVIVNGKNMNKSIELLPGGFYTYLITNKDQDGKLLTITRPNSVNLMWQLPQYFVITFAEIMFSITGLEFSFTQSPDSMKSVISSIWLLTDSFGNIIVLIVAGMKIFDSQAYEFFLFAGLMTIVMILFILIAMRYKYVEVKSEENETEDSRS
ncbi:peptide transporter family 1-like isoform X1 [Rhodnius prolixus]|uniref:peptide transporter family 1-like isoform X1 n=1 Tax=Rhodnius prolixus TaxID=13249 RepID=UPI003D187910